MIAYLLFNFNENNNYQKSFHSFENKDDIYSVDSSIFFKDKQPFSRQTQNTISTLCKLFYKLKFISLDRQQKK